VSKAVTTLEDRDKDLLACRAQIRILQYDADPDFCFLDDPDFCVLDDLE
jgi:hypothetical protein